MKKKMTYEHLENGKQMVLEFHIFEEEGHWVAKLRHLDASQAEVKTPTFYGTTAEQAERQLRKVLDKDYELIREEVLEE
jgi:hypothetical protein